MTTPTYEGLLDSARFFANRALRDYTEGDHRAVLMDAGTLLEHVSKALLIKANAAYLVEMKPGGFDHLLHLTGRGERAPQVGALRTIGANEAVARVQKIVDIRTSKADLDQVLHVRNGIVHAGAFDATRTRQLLTACLRYCEEVYDVLGVGERWGEHIESVVRLVEQSLSDIEHEFHRKVTAAKARLRALMSEIPEFEQTAVATARQGDLSVRAQRGFYNPSGQLYVGNHVDCPVCNHPEALCTGPLREDREFVPSRRHDEPDDMELVALWIEPEDLQCGVCGVHLSSTDEVRLAGIPSRLEIDDVRMYMTDGLEVSDDFYDNGPWTVD
ncbi:hypothetical protein amrb99_51590 [Actinomadura sp. RB99]|uniref:hypothetical protein n=1 Tax=Actinomadura sp. RB99 TaxID=2691577 RepID=UPI00168757C8|nr:hypothetical protein [Actinomadura sp. RB99]MBD2896215.1 hypothetical protein [Actinomadura sp. RB99]